MAKKEIKKKPKPTKQMLPRYPKGTGELTRPCSGIKHSIQVTYI